MLLWLFRFMLPSVLFKAILLGIVERVFWFKMELKIVLTRTGTQKTV